MNISSSIFSVKLLHALHVAEHNIASDQQFLHWMGWGAPAFILGMVFIVTVTYVDGDIILIMPSAILAFLLMLIREMVKDIADLPGDQKFNIQTFPVRFGINYTFQLIVIFFIILVFVSLYFYYQYFFNLEYLFSLLFCVLFPLAYYLYKLSKNKTAIYCIYLSKVLKLITIFGVIVIYLASI